MWTLVLVRKANGLYLRVGSTESQVELEKAWREIRRGFWS